MNIDADKFYRLQFLPKKGVPEVRFLYDYGVGQMETSGAINKIMEFAGIDDRTAKLEYEITKNLKNVLETILYDGLFARVYNKDELIDLHKILFTKEDIPVEEMTTNELNEMLIPKVISLIYERGRINDFQRRRLLEFSSARQRRRQPRQGLNFGEPQGLNFGEPQGLNFGEPQGEPRQGLNFGEPEGEPRQGFNFGESPHRVRGNFKSGRPKRKSPGRPKRKSPGRPKRKSPGRPKRKSPGRPKRKSPGRK
jgi:hypothetical protein